jgi:hypothetical protein
MVTPRLPRRAADCWPGGFVVESPKNTTSIGARAGTVLAGGETMYLLRPGAAGFLVREPPDAVGFVVASAIEPRRPMRLAVAGATAIVILDGKGVYTTRLPQPHAEPVALAWGPPAQAGGAAAGRSALYALFRDGAVLRFADGTGEPETIELPPVEAITGDERGGLALAYVDESSHDLVALVHQGGDAWRMQRMESPGFIGGVSIALAGTATALSFELEGVWVSRGADAPFVKIESLPDGGPIAFEGASDDAALFGVAKLRERDQAIVRIEADGRAVRIAEVMQDGDPSRTLPPVRDMAWDASRRTLWSAVGPGGVLSTTAPGAPRLGGSTAPS